MPITHPTLPHRSVAAGAVAVLVGALLVAAAGPAAAGPASSTDTASFTVQPTTTMVRTAVNPAIVVTVDGADGTADTRFTGPVSLTYADFGIGNSAGPRITGKTTVDAIGGVATFDDVAFAGVGFGFELLATATFPNGATLTATSTAFDVVDQIVTCQPGAACQTDSVDSQGTSGSVANNDTSTASVLTATGGGFPGLTCGTTGGVVSFTATASKIITVVLSKQLVHQAMQMGVPTFTICYGSPTSFPTLDGTGATWNPANGEYEGLLATCSSDAPPVSEQPCILHQDRSSNGSEVTTIAAPAGDPHIAY